MGLFYSLQMKWTRAPSLIQRGPAGGRPSVGGSWVVWLSQALQGFFLGREGSVPIALPTVSFLKWPLVQRWLAEGHTRPEPVTEPCLCLRLAHFLDSPWQEGGKQVWHRAAGGQPTRS